MMVSDTNGLLDGSGPSTSFPIADDAAVVVGTRTAMTAGSTGRTLEVEGPIFCPDIRREWIDAMFGPEFFAKPDYVPQRTGIGLCRIPSYVCYQVRIDPPEVKANEEMGKMGVTISRIPLGVYVRGVDVDGEAYAAGIIPGSVLISINNRGVLGDPSHKLLEKLWWYEGHCDAGNKKNIKVKEKENVSTMSTDDNPIKSGGPIALKLIKDGIMYTAILLGKAPFGITWAPCGNFALVQRTHSYAQKAGVQRGCLVAAVNGQNLRNMDHEETAGALRGLFAAKEAIDITCCYTPPDSRSRSTSTASNKNGKPVEKTAYRENGGVRLRQTEPSLEYGVGSFFSCGTNKAYMPRPDPKQNASSSNPDSIAALAIQVAAGNLMAPTGLKRTLSYFSTSSNMSFSEWADQTHLTSKNKTMPTRHFYNLGVADPRQNDSPFLNFQSVIEQWNPLNALLFCISRHSKAYNETAWIAAGGVIGKRNNGALSTKTREGTSNNIDEVFLPLHTVQSSKELIRSFCTLENAEMLHLYVLQFVYLLSNVDLYENILRAEDLSSTNIGNVPVDQKKEMQRISTVAKLTERTLDELIQAVIDVSSDDHGICQKLYYLIRSFIASMEDNENTNIQTLSLYSPQKVLFKAQQQLLSKLREAEGCNKKRAVQGSLHLNGHSFDGASIPALESNDTMTGQSTWSESTRISQVETIEDSILTAKSISSVDFGLTQSNLSSPSVQKYEDLKNEEFVTTLKTPPKPKLSGDSVVCDESMKVVNKAQKKKALKLGKLFRSKSSKDSMKSVKSQNHNDGRSQSTSISSPVSVNNNSSFAYRKQKERDTLEKKKSNRNIKNKIPILKKPNSILKKAAIPDSQPLTYEIVDPIYSIINQSYPMSSVFQRMSGFLAELEDVCKSIEKKLPKSFSQKITDWALQPWSPSKDKEFADVTSEMRNSLNLVNLNSSKTKGGTNIDGGKDSLLLLNPFNSSELLLSLIPGESYILPSAHFPLLLSFKSLTRPDLVGESKMPSSLRKSETFVNETLYCTKVEFLTIKGKDNIDSSLDKNSFIVHAALAGKIQETNRSVLEPYFGSKTHRWHDGNTLFFESRSGWGCPRTLSIRLSSIAFDKIGSANVSENGSDNKLYGSTEIGYSLIDLNSLWNKAQFSSNATERSLSTSFTTKIYSFDHCAFDQHGNASREPIVIPQCLEIELKISMESKMVGLKRGKVVQGMIEERRLLLFKHDDDLRQEMFAIQFVEVCDRILKAAGLDLKLKFYGCMPVGKKSGFIEWVPGVVSMSEICKPFGSALVGSENGQYINFTKEQPDESSDDQGSLDRQSAAYSARSGGWCKYDSLRSLRQPSNKSDIKNEIGLNGNNPVQQFLRANAYDPNAPYLICKDVMDNYVKSCAGYCIITYLLGVGDRHLDNLLMHQNGHFLHCDYSFILGQDPKTYLPMRITEEMVNGMGGFESDNFSKFFSLAGAAFIALRQHSSIRILMSVLRNLSYSGLPDISRNQTPHNAMAFLRDRFRLDLDEDEALSFIEELIIKNVSSKFWMAVDSIHSLGKRF